jgi:sodium-dependent dicarboxylate transporter 2/3/5
MERLSRTFGGAVEAVETFSPAEELFNRRRRTIGLFVGPLLFLALLAAPLPGLSAGAHRLGAILAMMIVFWITEALPMPVTALVGPVLAIVLQVAPARDALAPFADPIIFLFIGSFILAEAMFAHGLDRRIAYRALASRAVGSSPTRIVMIYGAVTAGLSMWISNTAATAMMFPIGLSIAAHVSQAGPAGSVQASRFGLALMLMTSFAASLGGMATPIGTPPNLIGIGMLERISGVEISFLRWMALGVPGVLVLFGLLLVLFHVTLLRGLSVGSSSSDSVRDELGCLGDLTAGERNVLIAFAATVTLWILPGLLAISGRDDSAFASVYAASMPEAVAALAGAILLFVLPISWRARRFTLTWNEAVRIDWGIILLFGGGLAMGDLAFSTGLASALGDGITSWLPVRTTAGLTALFTATAIVMSEATSNTAAATMIVPIAIAVAEAAGVRPIEPALGATLGASMGFMMPISTPPNAIVYSSGHVPITAMIRYGAALDVGAFFVIVGLVLGLGPLLY